MTHGLLNLLPNAVGQGQLTITYAEVALPAPTTFSDPLFVVEPDWTTDFPHAIPTWPACHGVTLPQVGDAVLLVHDSRGNRRCVWWDGQMTFSTQTSQKYYLTTASSNVPSHKEVTAAPFSPKTTVPVSNLVNGQVVLDYATPPSTPGVTFLPAGQFEFHVHALQTTGNESVRMYAEFWEYDPNTSTHVAMIGVSSPSKPLTATEVEYRLFFSTDDVYTFVSVASRIAVHVHVLVGGSGGASVRYFVGGESDSHVVIPIGNLSSGMSSISINWRGIWNSGLTYLIGDGVTGSDGHNYVSLVGGNLNHNPVGDGGVHWSDLLPSNVVLTNEIAIQAKNYAMPLVGDNAAALASAIADAVARGGDTVEARSGVHGFASAVSVPSLVNVAGCGKGTIFRATGNNYILAPTGTGSRITNLKLDATSSQSSGGGINFASLGSDVTIDNLTIGNNLFYTFDLRPANSGRGCVWIDRIRFDVVTGHNTPFKIGNGTNLITDVFITRVGGTASTNADVVQWFNILNNVDTLFVKNCDFYQGTAAMNLGNGGASGSVTGSKWTNVSFDSMGTTGVVIAKCRSLDWTDCTLSTIGGSGPGLQIAANAVGFNAKGGLVQNCNADGIDINAGSQYTDLLDVQVSDNNQGGAAFGAGIGVSAGATEFNISGCRSGNFLLGTAAQQRGIWVVAGASDHYTLVNNRTPGNSISGLIDGGTGVNKNVIGNL